MSLYSDTACKTVEPNILRSILARRFAIDPKGCKLIPIEGLSGVNWKALLSDNVTYLLRPQTQEKSQLGIDRYREARLLDYLAAYALAPCSFGVTEGWLIAQWLPGKPLTRDSKLLEVARLMVRLHSLSPQGERRDLRRHCDNYWQQLDPYTLPPQGFHWHSEWQSQVEPAPLKWAIVHLDVHPGNLICTSSGIKLIDWEYACVGDIALDLATLCRGYGWNNSEMAKFIHHYGQSEGDIDTDVLSRQVHRWLPFVDYMSWLWYEVRWQQTGKRVFRALAAKKLSDKEVSP